MRLPVVVVIGLLLLLSAFPVLSQDSASCGGGAFLERVDSLYAEHMASWNTEDDLAAFIGVEEYHVSLGEIIEACRSTIELMTSGVQETGTGTIDDPYAFNFFVDFTGRGEDEYRIRVNNILRPYTNDRRDIAQGYESILITLDVQCVVPAHLFCSKVTPRWFRLVGSNGFVYSSENISGTAELGQGGKDSFLAVFHVQKDEKELRLFRTNQDTGEPWFLSAEPEPGQIVEQFESKVTITSIANPSVRIRTGAGTVGHSVVGAFARGQGATAIGRNNSGTWVQFDRGWVSSEWVEASGDIMSLPVTG